MKGCNAPITQKIGIESQLFHEPILCHFCLVLCLFAIKILAYCAQCSQAYSAILTSEKLRGEAVLGNRE